MIWSIDWRGKFLRKRELPFQGWIYSAVFKGYVELLYYSHKYKSVTWGKGYYIELRSMSSECCWWRIPLSLDSCNSQLSSVTRGAFTYNAVKKKESKENWRYKPTLYGQYTRWSEINSTGRYIDSEVSELLEENIHISHLSVNSETRRWSVHEWTTYMS